MKYALVNISNRVLDVFETDQAIATGDVYFPVPDGIDVLADDYYDRTTGIFRRPTREELISQYRPDFNRKRNQLFKNTEWARQRHADRIGLGIDDSVNWTEWLNYWQALRDLPSNPDFDPRNPQWPEVPE